MFWCLSMKVLNELPRFAKNFCAIFLASQLAHYMILKPSIKVTASATNEATWSGWTPEMAISQFPTVDAEMRWECLKVVVWPLFVDMQHWISPASISHTVWSLLNVYGNRESLPDELSPSFECQQLWKKLHHVLKFSKLDFKEQHLFFLKNQYGHSCTSHTSAAGLYSTEWHPVSFYGVSPIPLRLHKQV